MDSAPASAQASESTQPPVAGASSQHPAAGASGSPVSGPAPQPADGSTAAPLAPRWWLTPAVLWLFSRLALVAFSYLSLNYHPNIHQATRDPYLQQFPAFDGLVRWDSGWFKQIAVRGYDPADQLTANFWPLYPMLIRAVMWVTSLDVAFAALVVSNLAGLLALIAVYRVYLHYRGADEARWALVAFVAFPFHFFQATGYPESLMVSASAVAMWMALTRHHFFAGVALGFGVLARHITILLGLGLFAAQLKQRGRSLKELLLDPSILALAVPFLFGLGFMVFEWKVFGDPLLFWKVRQRWSESAWYSALNAKDMRHYAYMAAALLPTFGTLVCLWKKEWRELGAAAAPLMLVLWTAGLEGLGRYAASVWPAFLPVGVWLARRPLFQGGVVGFLFLLQGLFFWLFAHQYPIN